MSVTGFNRRRRSVEEKTVEKEKQPEEQVKKTKRNSKKEAPSE